MTEAVGTAASDYEDSLLQQLVDPQLLRKTTQEREELDRKLEAEQISRQLLLNDANPPVDPTEEALMQEGRTRKQFEQEFESRKKSLDAIGLGSGGGGGGPMQGPVRIQSPRLKRSRDHPAPVERVQRSPSPRDKQSESLRDKRSLSFHDKQRHETTPMKGSHRDKRSASNGNKGSKGVSRSTHSTHSTHSARSSSRSGSYTSSSSGGSSTSRGTNASSTVSSVSSYTPASERVSRGANPSSGGQHTARNQSPEHADNDDAYYSESDSGTDTGSSESDSSHSRVSDSRSGGSDGSSSDTASESEYDRSHGGHRRRREERTRSRQSMASESASWTSGEDQDVIPVSATPTPRKGPRSSPPRKSSQTRTRHVAPQAPNTGQRRVRAKAEVKVDLSDTENERDQDAPPPMTEAKRRIMEEAETLEKRMLMSQFAQLERVGFGPAKKWSMADNINEMRFDFHKVQGERDLVNSMESSWSYFIFFNQIGELVINYFAPFGIDIKDWSDELDKPKNRARFDTPMRKLSKRLAEVYQGRPGVEFVATYLEMLGKFVFPKVMDKVTQLGSDTAASDSGGGGGGGGGARGGADAASKTGNGDINWTGRDFIQDEIKKIRQNNDKFLADVAESMKKQSEQMVSQHMQVVKRQEVTMAALKMLSNELTQLKKTTTPGPASAPVATPLPSTANPLNPPAATEPNTEPNSKEALRKALRLAMERNTKTNVPVQPSVKQSVKQSVQQPVQQPVVASVQPTTASVKPPSTAANSASAAMRLRALLTAAAAQRASGVVPAKPTISTSQTTATTAGEDDSYKAETSNAGGLSVNDWVSNVGGMFSKLKENSEVRKREREYVPADQLLFPDDEVAQLEKDLVDLEDGTSRAVSSILGTDEDDTNSDQEDEEILKPSGSRAKRTKYVVELS